MYPTFELKRYPRCKIFNELRREIATIPRPFLLKTSVKVPCGNLRNVDCVATEVEEMLRNECEATVMYDFVFRVNPNAVVGPTILGKRDFIINSHRVDQLTMSGTLAEIGPACPSDPIAYLSHIDNVAFLGAVLTFR
jgi:hypothetical protein